MTHIRESDAGEKTGMKKLRQLYAQNSIIQFLVSYILVLILPLFILSYGFNTAFKIVKQDIEDSYITMMSHSVSILDNEMEKLEKLALQMTQDGSVRAFAKYKRGDTEYITTALRALDNVYDLMNYQSVELLEAPYIYFHGMNLVMYDSAYYQPGIFEKYLKADQITMEQWRSITVAEDRREAGYERLGESLHYVLPFSEYLTGNNQGVLVLMLKRSVLKELFNFTGTYGGSDYLIQIFDKDWNLLWSDGDFINSTETKLEELTPDDYYEKDGTGIIYTSSKQTGWNFVLSVPEKQALNRLATLKNLVFLLSGAAVCMGIIISLWLAIRKGRPINQAFAVLASSGRTAEGFYNLGEVVTGILKNHEELLEELARDKPSLQKAFFHDLVKGEFTSEEQLKISARKAGIEMEGATYLTVCFELFSGNDFYDVDEQTLDEVHIISQLLEHYLEELCEGQVWFYKRNYRTTVAIFAVRTTEDELKDMISGTREWLLREYTVETNWGISNLCRDLLLIWKTAEEARIALYHCTSTAPIVEYRSELENIYEFYFPEIARDKLEESVRSGHMEETEAVLEILEKENCENRSLKRSQYMKLNRKVTELVPLLFKNEEEGKELVIWLNEVIMEPEVSGKEYFLRFRQICDRACIQNAEKKNIQRGIMIDEIKGYIDSHYMDSGMGLAQVGTVFRVSEGYLSSVFKEQAGINFADYLERIRMKKAVELLQDESNTVNEVAKTVGYNSVQSFRRAFKRATGISPKEARNKEI